MEDAVNHQRRHCSDQIVCWPLGHLMALLPYSAYWPLPWFINPEPFNIKEHAYAHLPKIVHFGNRTTYTVLIPARLVGNMALMGSSPLPVELLFIHKQNVLGVPAPYGCRLLLTLSSSLMGLGIAWLRYHALVLSSRMIWPRIFETNALLGALHKTNKAHWSRRPAF